MKTNIRTFINTLALAAVAGMLAGCATSGYEQGEKTATSLQQTASEIELAKGQVQNSLDALNSLMQKPGADLRPQYKTFSSSVSAIVATASRMSAKADAMKASGQAYSELWDANIATIQNPDIRSSSAARKKSVMDSLAVVQSSYQTTMSKFNPFLSNLQDIDKALSADLTPGGLDAMKDIAKQANSNGTDLIASLNTLGSDCRDLAGKMSTVSVKPAN